MTLPPAVTSRRQSFNGPRSALSFLARFAAFFSFGVLAAAVLALLPPLSFFAMTTPLAGRRGAGHRLPLSRTQGAAAQTGVWPHAPTDRWGSS